MPTRTIRPQPRDALVLIDLQKDFLPGGNLAVPEGDQVIPVANSYIDLFGRAELPIFATRDWHPPDHCSFKAQGGPWPPHCVANTTGAEFADDLRLPAAATVLAKATEASREAYSGFDGTDLHHRLQALGVNRLFLGGLATDVCVLNSVRDARRAHYEVLFLDDASRAVNLRPEDGTKAVKEMRRLGAHPITLDDLIHATV